VKLDIVPCCAFTFLAGENIAANILVKFDANGALVKAAATDRPQFIVYDAVLSGEYVAAYKLEEEFLAITNVPIRKGFYVQCGANGKLALEAVTGAAATTTLTSDATAPSNNDTVTIGATVYTFKTALSTGPTVPFEVLIGISAAVALDNLKSAVNGTAGAGTTYSTGTTAHPSVTATTNADTTQLFVAITFGAADNVLVSTEASTHLSFPAVTFATPGTGADPVANVLTLGQARDTATAADQYVHVS
jgi:hypothetical protein